MTYESIYILIDFCINFNNTFFTWRNFPFPRKYPQEPRSRVLAKKWAKGLRERGERDDVRRWPSTTVPSSFRRGPLFYTCEHFAGTMARSLGGVFVPS